MQHVLQQVLIRAEVSKSRRVRRIPLWWDRNTLVDIASWKSRVLRADARPSDLFMSSVINRTRGKQLTRQAMRQRFRTA